MYTPMLRCSLQLSFTRALLSACLLGAVTWTGDAHAASQAEAEDLAASATAISQLINCTPPGGGPVLKVSSGLHRSYCSRLSGVSQRFLKRFEKVEKPLLSQVVPQDQNLPVLYPFGGGDLLTALGTYPNAKEITTLSLEVAGDVRAAATVPTEKLDAALTESGANLRRLVAVEHSKTTNLSNMSLSALPAEIVFSLYAIHLWGFEPVALRYFEIDPNGNLNYLTKDDLKQRRAFHAPANIELQFRRPRETELRVFRHIGTDLSDAHFKKDDRVLQHLKSKGKVLAMTKAASYLLWWGTFSMIRQCLADAAVFMISDSTGFPPAYAKAQGFTQTTYGQFHGSFLPQANPGIIEDFIKMWKTQPQRPLPFRYGYPDNDRHGHMLVTKRETATH